MNLPEETLNEMRDEAINVLVNYLECIDVLGLNDKEEMVNIKSVPGIIIAVESFSILSVIIANEHPELSIEECIREAMKPIVEVGIRNARQSVETFREDVKDNPIPKDPIDIVKDAIKKARST